MVAKTFGADSGVNLHSRCEGDGPSVVVLHGLFGSGGNLGALSRGLRDAFRVSALDMPGHGQSQWLENYSVPAIAEVLQRWMDRQGLASVHVVGHSLGGKVAMELALAHPQRVDSLTVADIAPVNYAGSHDQVFAALKAVASAFCHSRREAAGIMREYLEEENVIQFLLGSLRRTGEGIYAWRMDVEGLCRDYDALMLAPSGGRRYSGQTLFIKGENSDYIRERHRDSISARFPAASLKVIPGTGHWLHVEKPDLFNSLVRRHLQATEQTLLQENRT